MSDAVIRRARSADSKSDLPVPRKPIIGVDLDNVCFPHTRELRPFAAEWIAANKRPAGTHAADVLDDLVEDAGWFAPEWHITPDEFFAIERYAIERGFFRNSEPIEGAAETLRELEAAGYRIRYVTARPQYLDAAQQTRDSLAEHGFPSSNEVLFVGEHFGSHLKSMLNYSLYIDDSVSNIRDFQATGIPYIIFDQVYNRELGDEHRVSGWHQVRQLVSDLLEQTTMPVDRSKALYEAEDYCVDLSKRIEQVAEKITTLTAERTALLRRGKNSVAKAKKTEIGTLESELGRLQDSLDDAEGRRLALADDVRRYDAWAREHPDSVRGPNLRQVLRMQKEVEEAQRDIAEREAAVAKREAMLDALGLGLDASLDGMSKFGTSGDSPREIVSYTRYTRDLPEVPRLLDSIAMMVARAHVNRETPYRVIDQRVFVRVDDETVTDIDLLAIRDDAEGLALQHSRQELLDKLPRTSPQTSEREVLAMRLRGIEQQLFLAIEVKTGHGKLSRPQKVLHQTLTAGGTAMIVTKQMNPDAEVFGLGPGVSIAASKHEIGIASSELIAALQTNRNLRRQLIEFREMHVDAAASGALSTEQEVLEMFAEIVAAREGSAPDAASEFGRSYEPPAPPAGN